MKVTYYGHACFSAVVSGKTLLFDPFISGNPLAKAIDVKSVPADFILVSHGHDDHVGDAVEIAKRTGALGHRQLRSGHLARQARACRACTA